MKYIEQFRIPSTEETPGLYGSSHSFRLHWDINTYCDKDCFYCYARAQLVWNKMSTKSTLDNIIDQLRKVNKPLEIALLGGEPSLHPLYFYILDQVEELPNLYGSAVISNAGKKVTPEWIDKHSKYKKFWFNYTFHASETPDVQAGYLDKIKYTRDNYDNVIANIMLLGPKWDKQINEVVTACEEYGITMRPNLLFKPKDCDGYMIENDKYREWVATYRDRFERYLYFSKDSMPRGRQDHQQLNDDISAYNDVDVYLEGINRFHGWKCLNNNYAVEGSNNTKITRMCDPGQTGEYMICPLQHCPCQGLLTNEKFKI